MDEPQAAGSAFQLPKFPLGFLWLHEEPPAHDLRGRECVPQVAPLLPKQRRAGNGILAPERRELKYSSQPRRPRRFEVTADVTFITFYPVLLGLALSSCLPSPGSSSKGSHSFLSQGPGEFLQILERIGGNCVSRRVPRWPCSALGVLFPQVFSPVLFPMFFPMFVYSRRLFIPDFFPRCLFFPMFFSMFVFLMFFPMFVFPEVCFSLCFSRCLFSRRFSRCFSPCLLFPMFVFPMFVFPDVFPDVCFPPSPQVAFRLDFEFSKSVFLQSLDVHMVASRSGDASTPLESWNALGWEKPIHSHSFSNPSLSNLGQFPGFGAATSSLDSPEFPWDSFPQSQRFSME